MFFFISNRGRRGLSSLRCDKTLRTVSQLHTYDYTDTAAQTNQAFLPQCDGHGWYQPKFKNGCQGTCETTQCLINKYGSNLFSTGEITAWHSNRITSSGAVRQWENSSGHRGAMESRSARYIGCEMFGKYGNCLFA